MSADLPVFSETLDVSSSSPAAAPDACAGCTGVDRRHFLASASWLSLGALAATACGDGVFSGPETLPVFPTENLTVDPRTITALSQVGGRTVLSFGEYAPIYLERIGNTQYRALSLACPHRGSIVSVGTGGFTCPNHGARFDGEGTWIGGQETASLAPLGVKVNADGTLTIGGAPLPPALSLSTVSVAFTATIGGAQPAAQTVSVDNTGGGILSGLQVSLAYAANQRTGWLAVALDQASTPARLTLTAQRGTIPAGSYSATVTVSAPSVSNGAQTLGVTMVVQDPNAPAVLQLSTTTVAFASTLGTDTPTQTVQCINGGGGTLSGLSAQIAYAPGGFGWLSANLSATTAPAALTLAVNPNQVSAGNFSATVTVRANGVEARTIAVSIAVVPQGLVVTIAAWPALASVGGVAGSVGNVAGTPVAVVRSGASSFAAFSMVCPHAGTTIGVVNGTSFRCPNHGALFDNQGILRPDSPQNTDNLTRRTVTYTPGAATLVVT